MKDGDRPGLTWQLDGAKIDFGNGPLDSPIFLPQSDRSWLYTDRGSLAFYLCGQIGTGIYQRPNSVGPHAIKVLDPSGKILAEGSFTVAADSAAAPAASTVTSVPPVAAQASAVASPPTAQTPASTLTPTPTIAQASSPSEPSVTGSATAISVGDQFVCAVTSAGGAKCWGSNILGMPGNGTNAGSTTPVDVTGLTSGVSAVAAARGHACALMNAGGVKCWGTNLVNGTPTSNMTPVDVTGLTSGVSAIAVGVTFSCAITTGGGVKCWGDNSLGQLGNGSKTGSGTPVDVTGLASGATALALGNTYACAVTSAGGVKCWGQNQFGLLANVASADSTTPVDVTGLTSGVKALSVGTFHACALMSGGGLKCLGSNTYGELGDGSTHGSETPVDVVGLTGVSAVVSGVSYTCALTSAGGVKCWGYNQYGELGNDSKTNSVAPVDVTGLTSGVTGISTAIAGSDAETCVVTSAGGATCWGPNTHGQLGNGTTTDSSIPVAVTGL